MKSTTLSQKLKRFFSRPTRSRAEQCARSSTTSISNFTYPPIDSSLGEIRILTVNPGEETDDLVLFFDVVKLEDDSAVDFDAISYRWEVQDDPQCVLLNEKPFFLSGSLRRMIRDLRYTDAIRRIWIDAICIDQANLAERSQQVQIMRRIYNRAHCVCIWINYTLHENSPEYRQLLKIEHEPISATRLAEEIASWTPIYKIFELEYFKRVWVQQEISCAGRLSLQCKKTFLPLNCIASFLNQWLQLLFLGSKDDLSMEFWFSNAKILQSFPLRLHDKLNDKRMDYENESIDLLEVLHLSDRLVCTDPRDRIYGLMYFSYEWRQNDLPVDYSLPVSEVYTQAIIAYFAVYGNLAFLEPANFSYDGYENILATDRTPSWVPDCRKHLRYAARNKLESQQYRQVQLRQNFSHLGRISGNLLYIYGCKVVDVRRPFDFWSQNGGFESCPVRIIAQTLNRIISESTFPPTRKARVLRLIELIGPSLPDLRSKEPRAFLDAVECFETFVLKNPDDETDGSKLLPMVGFINLLHTASAYLDVTERERSIAALSNMLKMLLNLSSLEESREVPFICTSGTIGLASVDARPGDEIWLIPTCERPIVLRPTDDGKYLVLGHASYQENMTWDRFPGAFEAGQTEAFLNERNELCLK